LKCFNVGTHVVRVSQKDGRWTVAVDERSFPTWYLTLAEAWEAGVHEADHLDRLGTAGKAAPVRSA
jgi:hypothetical protein